MDSSDNASRQLAWRSCGCSGFLSRFAAVSVSLSVAFHGLTGIGAPVHNAAAAKATGTMRVQWNGGGQGGGGGMGGGEDLAVMGSGMSGVEKSAFADFSVFGTTPGEWGVSKGEFSFLVVSGEDLLVVHRQVTAEVLVARVDPVHRTAQCVGLVVYDSKSSIHGGGPGGGGADGGHEDGGCSGGGETTEGGGCTDGTYEGGCGGGAGGTELEMAESGHDGGCGGGCSGSEESHEDGCNGGGVTSGGSGSGNGPCGGIMARASGNSSRVGQLVFAEVTDLGTPAMEGDKISWRWFIAKDRDDDGQVDEIELALLADAVMKGNCWPHLCAKTILGGNLVVHPN